MKTNAALFFGLSGETPLGKLWLAASPLGLVALACERPQVEFEAALARRFKCLLELAPDRVQPAAAQVAEYLSGRRRQFNLEVDWNRLSPFQRIVLQATANIPYGETRSYKDIAVQINRPTAARAVGRAEATNPLPLIIPCHRVIGTDGKLHGYGLGAGLKTKEWLLKLEGAIIA